MISQHTQDLLTKTTVSDNHACMPMRPSDESFLPQIERHKKSIVNMVLVNIVFDIFGPDTAFGMLATLRHWVSRHSDQYSLVE